MNNDRRKAIALIRGEVEQLAEQLDSVKTQLEDLRDEEQEYFDNMPESLQGGEKGDAAQEAVNQLDSAIDALDIDFDSATGALEEAQA